MSGFSFHFPGSHDQVPVETKVMIILKLELTYLRVIICLRRRIPKFSLILSENPTQILPN